MCVEVGVGPGCESCNINADLWDCVGEDREWGLVFVDLRKESDRTIYVDVDLQ